MSDQCTQVIHKQEGEYDTVKIYDASGIDILTGTWPVNTERTALESAVDALWSGYFEVQDRRHLFGKYPVAVVSSVNGAVDQFVKEFEGEKSA